MKTLIKGVFRDTIPIAAAIVALLTTGTNAPAVDGRTLSLHCSNVVLSWPSIADQSYIIQYRPTLDRSTPWQTLTNSYLADGTTNITIFVHSNIVQLPRCGGSGGGSLMATSLGPSQAELDLVAVAPPPMPMAMRADASGSAAPVAIYPPGYDFSNFIIFEPSSGKWVSGAGATREAILAAASPSYGTMDGPVPGPLDGGPGGGTNSMDPPDMGFYQVVQDGVQIANSSLTYLTNSPLSGTVNIKFEAGNPDGSLESVYLLVDGVPCQGAEAVLSPSFDSGKISFDTCFLENGDHWLQVQAEWLNPDISDLNNPYFVRTSAWVTLSVSNLIYYPEWEPEIGELNIVPYFVKTTCTNADWQIAIYDVNTILAKELSGHTLDGIIETYWDMVDVNGVSRTNTDVDTEFRAVITVADPVTKALPPQKPVVKYPTHGQWVVAYQDTFSFCANSNQYYQAIYLIGSLGAQFGGAVTYLPSSPTNGQTWPLRYPYTNPVVNVSPTTMQLDASALESLLTMTNSRNFYYNGHGNSQAITSYLNKSRVASALKGRPYRFVFLDSCLGAKSRLAAAFGNYATTKLPLSFYQKHKNRPRAFLGYDHVAWYTDGGSFSDSTGTYNRRVKPEVYEFLENFEFYWYYGIYGAGLESALYNAFLATPQLPYGWENGDGLQLYGYADLGIDDYNCRSDWAD